MYRALRRHARACAEERELERVHEGRKRAIDGYFEVLRERAREEEEKVKREKLDKMQKDKIKEKLREVSVGIRRAEETYGDMIAESGSNVPYVFTPSQ